MQRVKFLAVILFATLSLSPIFAQRKVSDQRLDASYQQAMDLFRKEKYASAQQQFDILAQQPAAEGSAYQSDAVYYAAVCSQQLGLNDALYRLDEFLRLYPESAKTNMARFYQGNYHYARGEYSLALKYYQMLSTNEVEYGHRNEYDFKMGYCYLSIGEYEKAKSCLSRVLGGKSKYRSSAQYYYAHIQYMEGDYAQALKSFQKLQGDKKFAKIVPSYVARIYYYLGYEDELLLMAPSLMNDEDVFKKGELQQMIGEVYFNRGEYAEALRYYNAANETMQNETTAPEGTTQGCITNDNTYQMGYCYYMLHSYDSAALYLSRKTACNDSVAQNALYTLGDTYLKLNRKSEARSMFLQASQMDFDPKIKEDALFNYAKLSCELNMNPYNESIRSFENYLSQYPRTKHKEEIQEILTSLYCTTRNYKDALNLIEKIEPKNASLNQAYQRIVINRGIELFNERNLQEAAKYFQKAVKINALPKNTTDAYYLYAESQYRLDNLKSARTAFDKFFLSTNAKTSPYYAQALYTNGYLCIRQERYVDGESNFRLFLNQEGTEYNQRYDARNRLGDCLYMQKRFADAIAQYNYVINASAAPDADYATYQKALSYGAMGKNEEKLTYLNYIFERYKNSSLASKALLEIANTYRVCDNNEMALLYFGNFVKQYPTNSHVKEALLDMGLIYYNTERDSLALSCFDQLLSNYQGTDEARDALLTVKNIYIAQNRVDDYFNYVKSTTKMSVSSSEQDSTTFMAAANRYYEGDCDNAIPGLENYLKKFPRGLFRLSAHYYLADCLFKSGLNEQALVHYEAVAEMNKNQYTETSLSNAANIAYAMGNYTKALDHYVQLVAFAENDNTRLQGRIGLLRCWNRMESHSNIVSSAQALMEDSKATEELRDEALLYEARSYYRMMYFDSADRVFYQLQNSSNGEYSGEALYSHAEILYNLQRLDQAEKAIENIAANPPSDYWLAKSFILWADIFYARGNALQAKQTLQSIIDNYDGEELVTLAIQKRNAILEAEAAASAPQQSEEEVVIELDGE